MEVSEARLERVQQDGAEAEGPGENLLRKSRKAKLGSSPVPGSRSKPVLPPIPPGQTNTNP
ncbi:hypothetical protein DV515_00016028 [Chloebia gouldiae]|uniref:Uncharacterized protein n=1 Tax=Chloebia gouldiae TaxID=44316 RepID=A0A3L8RTX0_CHLGU|nr:hypothetical protein DV515_00016028 [Chloebia gouldiae]